MDNLAKQLLSQIPGDLASSVDVGKVLKEEVEEAISPVTGRIDRLESKIQLLIMAVERVEKLMHALQPIASLINKLPFLK